MMHIPAPLAFLAIVAEFCWRPGADFRIVLAVAALGIFVNMLVAIAMVHSKIGFFMNWSGDQKGKALNTTCSSWRLRFS